MLQQTFMAEQESGLFLLTSKDPNVRIFTPRHALYFTTQDSVTLPDDSFMNMKKNKTKTKTKSKKKKNNNNNSNNKKSRPTREAPDQMT